MEQEEKKRAKLKQEEKSLLTTRKRNNLYRAAIENSPSGFAILRVIHNQNKKIDSILIVEINQSFAQFLKREAFEIIGARLDEILPFMEQTKENWLHFINRILHTKETLEFRHYYEDRWLKISMFSQGRNHILLQMYDNSEEMEQLIKYENFFLLNLDLLCIGDRKGRFLKINREWSNVLGYSVEELESMSIFQLIYPEDRERILRLINNVDIKAPMIHFTARFSRKDGGYRVIESKCHLQEEFVYIAARDITDRTELEQMLKEKNTLLQQILNNAPVAVYVNYLNSNHDFTNRFIQDNYTMTIEEMKQGAINDTQVLNNSAPLRYEEAITFRDGKQHIIDTIKTRLYREDGSILGTLGIGLDITERKESEEALRISESKYRLLAEATSDAIWVYNLTQDKFTYVSPTIQVLRGFTVEETLNQRLQDMVTEASYPELTQALKEIMTEFMNDPVSAKGAMIETQLSCKNGNSIWSEISARFRYNILGEIEIVGISRDIEKRKNYESEVLYLSYHDQLTGLYNRRYYEEELIRINIDANYPITLVMADVNGLKLTNDAFGHVFGDRLLITFANILKKECRNNDISARIGGDEFVILLPRTNSIQAEKIVDRIQSVLKNTMVDNMNLSVSFGWKTKYRVNEEFDEIYKQAEDAMYRRKLLVGKSYKSDTLKLITKSLYEKSIREQLHCERVSSYCRNIGLAMGMDSDDINELGLIGLLHDIGKVGINAEILNRSGPLSEEEWEDIKRHPEIGYHILRSVNEFAEIAEYVLAHHERIDGKGYPNGLYGSEIPLKSKILHIAEAFEVMTGDYPYRSRLTVAEAISELKSNAGTQFDDVTLHIFIEKVLKTS